MQSEEYIYSFSDEEINRTNCIIERMSKQKKYLFDSYSERENLLLESYNFKAEIELSCEMALKTRNIIKEICNDWACMINGSVNVLLTGSFSRNTCKSFSDIDITLLYPDDLRDSYAKYEELLYYILMKVFDLPRRSVHPVLTCGCNNEWSNNKKDCLVRIQSDDFFNLYKVEACASEVFVRSLTNKKSIDHINCILKDMVSKSVFHEWIYNVYWPLTEDEKYNSLLSIISLNIRKNISQYKVEYLKSINEYIQRTRNIEICDISGFKKYFQLQVLQFVFDVIQIVLINEEESSKLVNIRMVTTSLLTGEHSFYSNLFFSLYEYLWSLKKAALTIKQAGFIYSSHFTTALPDDISFIVLEMKMQTIKILSMLTKLLSEV